MKTYSPDHEVILYEAATHPLEQTRADKIRLCELPQAALKQITTLVIPAANKMQIDQDVVDQLRALSDTILA